MEQSPETVFPTTVLQSFPIFLSIWILIKNVLETGTVWKFHELCIIQISRETNREDSWSAKSAILPYLEVLNFDFDVFVHFLKAEIYQMNKVLVHSP